MKICLEQLLFNPLLYKQGGEFDLSIFLIFKNDRPWSNHSGQSFKKVWQWSNGSHQSLQIANLSHRSFKKIEKIDSLSSIFEKDWKDRIALVELWKRLKISSCSKKRAIRLKNTYVSYVFDSLPPFLCKRLNCYRRSSRLDLF